MENLLIIFIRNPELGKVKTRLAATIGPEKALSVYQVLLKHTYSITRSLDLDKAVYYSDKIVMDDMWEDIYYKKFLQEGENLGARMRNAIEHGFSAGYKRICLIGSDCYELTSEIIRAAFDKLLVTDVVLGPSEDGGYYLIGMNNLQETFFTNKAWSTNSVLAATLHDIDKLNLTVSLLPTLTDVDEEKDLTSISLSVFNRSAILKI